MVWFVHLCDKELGDPLGQSSLLAGQDHLQHVSVKLLHDDKHSLRRLKHAVQVDHAWVMQTLQGGGVASFVKTLGPCCENS